MAIPITDVREISRIAYGFYSDTLTPEPPISFGRSFIFGNPSFIRSLVS